MFNNMKNKIREKTGSDLPKFSLGQIQQKLGRHSRQGSETSLSSIALDDEGPPPIPSPPATVPEDPPPILPLQPDNNELTLADGKSLTPKDLARLAKREDEWRSRLEKRDLEWNKKLQKREAELMKLLEDKEKEWRRQEQALTEDLLRSTRELKDALKVTEEYKRKMVQYQEDKDQLEGFQTQELAKIKHLLLAKEQENAENATALKEATVLVESMKQEVNRLRPFEEQVSNFQDDIECLRHSSEKERWLLSSQLAQAEETVRHLRDRVAVLTCRSEAECVALGANLSSDERVQALLGERALLERRLEEAHVHLSDIKASWSGQIAALETQVGRLSRQAGEEGVERRRAEERIKELEIRAEEEQNEKQKVVLRLERVIAERDNLAQELKNVAHDVSTTKSENVDLADRIIDAEKRCLEKQAEIEKLLEELSVERGKTKESYGEIDLSDSNLLLELNTLKEEMAVEKRKTESLEEAIRVTQKERDEAQLRNAQISQEVQLANQQLRSLQQEYDELYKSLNKQLNEKIQEVDRLKADLTKEHEKTSLAYEQELQTKICDLEVQLNDKNKMVRVLQQRLNDLKKTLQRELKSSDPGGGGGGAVIIASGNNGGNNGSNNNGSGGGGNGGGNGGNIEINHNTTPVRNSALLDDDVNFKYLKHVLIKFLTCREYEAQHLTRAVATLLKFSPEEERLLRDTLDWKMSWFGSRPRLPKYKTIPDS